MRNRIVITAATSINVAAVMNAMTNHVVNLPKSDVQRLSSVLVLVHRGGCGVRGERSVTAM
jgi:hypothetical protein